MTWAKFSDTSDEELAFLSHAAHRLYIDSVTYSRRLDRGGRLHHRRDVEPLAGKLRIARLATVVAELVADVEDDGPLWVQDGDYFLIRNYAKFNPLTSAERMRKHRNRPVTGDAPVTHSDVTVTHTGVTVTPPRASARAPGSPVPVPVPIPVPTEQRSNERVQGARENDPFLSDVVDTFLDDPAVGAYHEAANGRGLTVSPAKLALLGASTRELRQRGTSDEVLVGACLRQAERGGDPKRLDIDVEFIERQRTGSIAAQAAAATERLRAGTVGR